MHRAWREGESEAASRPERELFVDIFKRRSGRSAAAGRSSVGQAGSDDRLVAALGQAREIRRSLSGRSDSQRPGAEADVVRALRRDRGRADDFAAGTTWWRSELGLSVLLAARWCVHRAGPVRPGVSGRGRSVRELDAACDPADAAGAAGAV